MTRLNKLQNCGQIWQECSNYQTGNFLKTGKYAEGFNGKSKQHARAGGQSKETWKILAKNQKETLEIKNSVTETKNAFDEFNRLNTTEEKISELENILLETSQTEK